MSEFSFRGERVPGGGRIRFVVEQQGKIVLAREVIPDESGLVPLYQELSELTGTSLDEVEDQIVEIVTAERYRQMLKQERTHEAQETATAAAEQLVSEYFVIDRNTPERSESPELWGMWRGGARGETRLSNFIMKIDKEVELEDETETRKSFAATIDLLGEKQSFHISATDYADNGKLQAAIFNTAGSRAVIAGSVGELRKAVSTLSLNSGIRKTQLTTRFGWNEKQDAYCVQGGNITKGGFVPASQDNSRRVELGDEEGARHLDFKPLNPEDFLRVKQHITEDLLKLQDSRVTYSLLGAVAAAVLQPFASGAGRFSLWLIGLTGSGKSFAAKLFMNFFGDFPLSSGRFVTWSSTPNFIQRQGYFFKDALYLVDDFKPEVIPTYSIVRILQTYADGTARGRLKSDASTNTSRPIRGLLLCTGEDLPENNASAVARSVVVTVPQREKNIEVGSRCEIESQHYSGVTVDFIRWLLAEKKVERFQRRWREIRQDLYRDVAGQQNDIRVASNLAILGASFELFAEFHSNVWAKWREESRRYVTQDLVAIRDEMLGEVKEQQASEVFLSTLGELVRFNHVSLDGQFGGDGRMVIGRQDGQRCFISTKLALGAVNDSLRKQGCGPLKVTPKTLLHQLREDGKLVDHTGCPYDSDAKKPVSFPRRFDGKQSRGFFIDRAVLMNGTEQVLTPMRSPATNVVSRVEGLDPGRMVIEKVKV